MIQKGILKTEITKKDRNKFAPQENKDPVFITVLYVQRSLTFNVTLFVNKIFSRLFFQKSFDCWTFIQGQRKIACFCVVSFLSSLFCSHFSRRCPLLLSLKRSNRKIQGHGNHLAQLVNSRQTFLKILKNISLIK